MDKQSKETTASTDDADLTVFVRRFQELEPSDLDLVAGGSRLLIVPNG